jgi:mono/diheme cytochrome c family protein
MRSWKFHGILTLSAAVVATSAVVAQQPPPAATPKPVAARVNAEPRTANPNPERGTRNVEPADAGSVLVKQYCTTCHNDRVKTGGLTLAGYDAAHPEETAAISEKMIRKLRAGMMPPAGVKRPDDAALATLVTALEARIDKAAAGRPNPGHRPFQRLNRAEYARAVKDLLEIEVDVNAFLPPDTISHGFDNISDEQSFSPTLMEGYLRAASQISRLAVGDRTATAGSQIYHIARTASQMRRVEGAPIGTRGGISVVHNFPADGEYVFKMLLHSGPTGDLFGGATRGEQIEVSINGERAALLPINHLMRESDPNGLNMTSPPIYVKAGPQRVTAAFINMADGPVDDLMHPIEHTLADTNVGETFGITGLPHLREFAVVGPTVVTGVSDTPSRRRIFTCRPTTAAEETPCATAILQGLAKQAYRGTVSREDFADLMRLYEQGRASGDFESGIRLALQGVLANPRFLFRLEEAPATLKAGQIYRISDIALASRLSFFLWGTVPDAELVKVAIQGTLKQPAVLDAQLKRMLADPRSEALATRFAGQWLRLQDVDKVRPDPLLFPHWDHTLTEAFVRETELFFDSLIREDRNVLDMLTADYTFVNERLAKHYDIPNVMGNQFRRVQIPEPNRRGILGQGSILLLTSVADRTSPVQRGKWVMEVLLGTPPPPPPPNVPALEETKGAIGAKLLSVRERMEEHRKNPACNSCHRVIDPLGLALENYDATGAWRIKDSGVPVDPSGELYDGTKMDGPAGLRAALMKHADAIVLSFTESLMTYALGRSVEYYDMPAVRAIVRDAANNGNRMSSFISGVVKSAAFQMSRAEGPVLTEETSAVQPRAAKASRR